MILILYRLIIGLYILGIRAAAFFGNRKAVLWIEGRKNWRTLLQNQLNTDKKPIIWMHCASLGEFEQGKPVLEEMRKRFPERFILLTFFSPSGYEIRKNEPSADFVMYLPADTLQNAQDFIRMLQPETAIFIKYDNWYYFLKALNASKCRTVLISAHLHAGNISFFSKLYLKKVFNLYTHIFVQDENSRTLLKEIFNVNTVTVAGDTRFDRTYENAVNFQHIPSVAELTVKRKVIVCGSVWEKDLEVIAQVSEKLSEYLFIIAPHELHLKPENYFNKFQLYSRCSSENFSGNVLWVDTIGILSRLYFYADLVYVGGGFGKGIHNILEPAAFGKTVLFGPNYKRFKEAVDLKERKLAFVIRSDDEMYALIRQSEQHPVPASDIQNYVKSGKGAKEKIIAFLTE